MLPIALKEVSKLFWTHARDQGNRVNLSEAYLKDECSSRIGQVAQAIWKEIRRFRRRMGKGDFLGSESVNKARCGRDCLWYFESLTENLLL